MFLLKKAGEFARAYDDNCFIKGEARRVGGGGPGGKPATDGGCNIFPPGRLGGNEMVCKIIVKCEGINEEDFGSFLPTHLGKAMREKSFQVKVVKRQGLEVVECIAGDERDDGGRKKVYVVVRISFAWLWIWIKFDGRLYACGKE